MRKLLEVAKNPQPTYFTAVIYTQSTTESSSFHHTNPLFKLVSNVASSHYVHKVSLFFSI